MFIRKTKNRSGTISVQITQKIGRKNKVIKTVGVAQTDRELELLMIIAQQELEQIRGTQSLFIEPQDLIIDAFVSQLANRQLQLIGPQLILAPIFEKIGLDVFGQDSLLKPLVISRLIYPGSKLKTCYYLQRHFNIDTSVYTIYRYLDTLSNQKCAQIQQIIFKHSSSLLAGQIGVAFYDLTTLYFEASDQDDIRKIGYSKDGKTQHPQIMLGLLVGSRGYPLGYELFEGNKSETKTLLPVLENFERKFGLQKPIVVADAALLSQQNLEALKNAGYQYIIGARLKNQSQTIHQQILSLNIEEPHPQEIPHSQGRLIIAYSAKRAKKDLENRKKGLKRLEEKVKSGRLTKKQVNNRGYNKYLLLEGELKVKIDYQKFQLDQQWDGLKGYITNTNLKRQTVIEHYHQLWWIEKAFRISKTDLQIRPIFHRLEHRINAHICICFAAYAVYKELERKLTHHKTGLTPQKALELIKDIQQITYQLPKSKVVKKKILQMDEKQKQLMRIIEP